MSYILDALRRADAERDRGEVPGLHTQQFGVLPGDDDAPRQPRLLIATIVVLVVALTGVLAWIFFGGNDAQPKTVLLPVPVTQPPMPMPVAPAPMPMPVTQPPMPMPVAMAPSRAASQAAVVSPPAPASTVVANQASVRRVRTKPPIRRGVAEPAAAAMAADRIYTLAELPESVRRELPQIAFGGASYSGDKASRMVILNGQVFHEGDTVAPGLLLKQVKQKGAVLAYKGYRYELGF